MPDPNTGLFADDWTIGNPAAKVVLIEYASLTCPHCAAFNAGVMPKIKADYVDTGKVYFVYRHFPLNEPALRAAMVANCQADANSFFGFIDLLFTQQAAWAAGDDWASKLYGFAQLAGFDETRFKTCFEDETSLNSIISKVQYAVDTYEVGGTPTLILNGEKLQLQTFDELIGKIDAALQ